MIFKKTNTKYTIKKNTIKLKTKNVIYNYTLKLNKKEENTNTNNLKILHLSDTHFHNNKNLIIEYKYLTNILKNEKFDLIIHTGDIINKKNSDLKKEFTTFLKTLNSKYGKYYVLGNHDYYSENIFELKNKISKTGFKLLNNSNKKIKIINSTNKGQYINIIGIDDHLKGEPKLEKVLKNIKMNEFNILLTHNLDALKKDKIKYFDLILSGHLHAGEMNFFIFDGVDYLKLKKHYKNVHKQKKEFKQLSNNCISFIHPGNYSFLKEKTKIINRLFTQKAGIVILNLDL